MMMTPKPNTRRSLVLCCLLSLLPFYELHSAGPEKSLTTYCLPLEAGDQIYPSPIYLSIQETRFNAPASKVLKNPQPGSPDQVFLKCLEAVQANDPEAFAEAALPGEKQADEKFQFYRTRVWGANGNPQLISRFDAGPKSLFLTDIVLPKGHQTFTVKRVNGKWGWTGQSLIDPLEQTVMKLQKARSQDTETLQTKVDVSGGIEITIDWDLKDRPPLKLAFERTTPLNWFAHHPNQDVKPVPDRCPKDVQKALVFYSKLWSQLMDDPDAFKKDLTPETQKIIKPKRIAALQKYHGNPRRVQCVAARPDQSCYVIFYRWGKPLLGNDLDVDIVVRDKNGDLKLAQFQTVGPFKDLLGLPEVQKKLKEKWLPAAEREKS